MIPFVITFRRFRLALWAVWRDEETRPLPILACLLLVAGTAAYSLIEDWGVLDSLLYSVLLLTTVGTGTLPTQPLAKVFTILYVLSGLGVMIAFAFALGREWRLVGTEKIDRRIARLRERAQRRRG